MIRKRRRKGTDIAVIDPPRQEVLEPVRMHVQPEPVYTNVLYITHSPGYGNAGHVRIQKRSRILSDQWNHIGPGSEMVIKNTTLSGGSIKLILESLPISDDEDFIPMHFKPIGRRDAGKLIKHDGWTSVSHFARQNEVGRKRFSRLNPKVKEPKEKKSKRSKRGRSKK